MTAEPSFVLEYEYRSDNGPHLVGPFPTRDAAQAHADSLRGPGWEACYSVCPLVSPEES